VKQRSLWFLYLGLGTWTAAVGPFSSVILRSHQVDTATIGILAAVAALSAMVIVPLWGHLGDILAGRTVAYRVALVVASGAAVALLLPLPVQLFAVILATFTVYPGMFHALSDSLAVGALPDPDRQYGPIRALASLSFAVGSIVAGFLYNQAGYGAVPVVALVWSAALFLVLGSVPDETRGRERRARAATHGGDAAAGRFGSVSRAISVQPRLLAVLAVFTLSFAGLLGAITFVGIRIADLGGQPSDVALSYGIASFAEIPGLVLAGWFGRKFGIRWLVVLTLVAHGLCVVSWGILPLPIAINATRLLTGLALGAFTAARVVVIARMLPVELQATGQALMQAATFGLGSALGALVGGLLYGPFGPMVFFGVAGGMAIVGGLGAWVVLYGPLGDPSGPDEMAVDAVLVAAEYAE
jgi:PPP family 3-phenylpropionic acid transporter